MFETKFVAVFLILLHEIYTIGHTHINNIDNVKELVAKRWKSYKQKFNLEFSDSEEAFRIGVFRSNLEYIHYFNEENHGFQLGENQFTHWTHEEYLLWLGKSFEPFDETIQVKKLPDHIMRLGIRDVDWRALNKVTPVKNQGGCGSCYAFSTIGAVESVVAIKTNTLLDLSEQEIVDCSTTYGNLGCNGGALVYSYRYIRDNGVYPESAYPYTAMQATCKRSTLPVNTATKITGYSGTPNNDETSLATAVTNLNPVAVSIDASSQSFMLYKSGVYYNPTCSSTAVNHGVLVVGIGSSPSPNYIIKNSWGTAWGDQGYIYLVRNQTNNCGIAKAPVYPVI